MNTNSTLLMFAVLLVLRGPVELRAAPQIASKTTLTAVGEKLETHYSRKHSTLKKELTSKLSPDGNGELLNSSLASDKLDTELTQFAILNSATPRGLAKFAQQGDHEAALVDRLLKDTRLMKQMLVADGPSAERKGKQIGAPRYGEAMKIYADIQCTSPKANASILAHEGIFQRLALAVSLEHAVPITQANPLAKSEAGTDADVTINPVNRYLHFEEAFLDGELDPAFESLSVWELRMVVNGDEPDETLAWGRKMIRNYRPDHIYNTNYGWRYVGIVTSDVKYGSQDVKHDRPELQKYQNMLMNGGVCGRRAFFGRFILRSFGIPTTARPSRGHAALAHWTPAGWVVNLGGGWGAGWTKTQYKDDLDFLATTQARANKESFLRVKRAQWAGEVFGEKRTYGEHELENGDVPDYWYGVALQAQRAIIDEAKAVTLDALGEDLGEANEPTVAEKVIASPVTASDRQINYDSNGTITIPAAAYSKPSGNTRDVVAMKSFGGGLQVFLPRFFPKGKTILRGGTWKGVPEACSSGSRMLSGGYGKYENWGLRVAMSPPVENEQRTEPQPELKLDLGDGITIELVYIEPGTFVMGGEKETDGRFECFEVPKHDVELTQGFYLGKYEVTQAQYQAIMGSNPSKSTKAPNCPVDNVGAPEAQTFCGKLVELTGRDVRLPTEAEWEFASRGGRDTKWFFGNDPSTIGEYAWFKDNAGGKSHPVGEKRPNPFGLYDIYGNVNERISDTYARNYYSTSPKVDPTGPSQGTQSRFEYKVTVPQAGQYSLTSRVVTVNYDQRLVTSVNEAEPVTTELPFTSGDWQVSQAVTLDLKQGENTIRFWRDRPPQSGLAVKEFTLTPMPTPDVPEMQE